GDARLLELANLVDERAKLRGRADRLDVERGRSWLVWARRVEVMRLDEVRVDRGAHVLHQVLELAHVAGPRPREQLALRGRRQLHRRATLLRAGLAQEQLGEDRQLARAIAERWQPHRRAAEPEVEIAAEP